MYLTENGKKITAEGRKEIIENSRGHNVNNRLSESLRLLSVSLR